MSSWSKCIGLILIIFSGWLTGLSATPTPTATSTIVTTATPTITITVTSTSTVTVLEHVGLSRNRINPVRGQSVGIVGLQPKHEKVTISVYTQEGYLVKKLWDDMIVQYPQVIEWDGKNASDSYVASGIYVIVINGRLLKKRLRVAVIK